MAQLFLRQDKFEEQKPGAEKDTLGSPLHCDPEERKSKGQEEGATHTLYCQQPLGSLLWLVTRTRSDLAWAYSVAIA